MTARTFAIAACLVLAAGGSADAGEPGFAFKLGDNWRVTPYVAPGYTPEMGGLIAAGGLFSFATSMADTVSQRSSVPLAVAYSTTGAVTVSSVLTSFWKEDRLRIPVDLWFKAMPDHYYGVGYDAGRHTVATDSTTAYDRTWFWFNPRFLVQVKGPLYAGLDWDINYTRADDPGTVMLADPTFVQFGSEDFNHGLGAVLQYDSRDVPVNAWRGTYFSGRARFYGTALGGDNDYQIYDVDYRNYIPLGRPGRTLAWEFRTRIGKGDVPWAELSQPGTPFDLRGYRWGRYRDKAMMYMLLEYRSMLGGGDGDPGPHGLVGWVGGGSIAPRARDFTDWLPNFGVGYRLEVQPRMNVRLDVGFAQEEDGWQPALYFNFNETF
jgi:outer membrane protein assembly factor BamA